MGEHRTATAPEAGTVAEGPAASVDLAELAERDDGDHRRRVGPAWWIWILDHPLLVVAVVAGLVAVGHGIWIWGHRPLGGLDPDEAGYIATAFRYERLSLHDPLALPRAIGGTGTGPLVPLVTVPLLWIGPHDVRTALLVQPSLMVVTAVFVAGIARRLAGPGAAIASGLALVVLPTVVFASQTYWLGLGAACSLAGAIWALLASERLTNRWTYAFGFGVGCMVLCRTMALGYLPAVAIAGAVVAGRQARSWRGLVAAGATTLVVAGPWYVAARSAIFDYLFSYGYGERAGLFGEGGLPARIEKRLTTLGEGLGVIDLVLVALVLVSAGWAWRSRRGWPAAMRDGVAVAALVAAGFAALCSTTNNGVWFELPIVVLVVPLLVAAASRAPWPVWTAGVAVATVAGVAQLLVSWWMVAPGDRSVVLVDQRHRSSQYEHGFAEYDPRYRPERRAEQAAASADWREASVQVERELDRLAVDRTTIFTFSGNFEMLNSNSVQLVGELRGWTPRIRVPDTVQSASDRAADLTPTTTSSRRGGISERILVVALHDQHLFTPDERVRAFYRQAVETGWEPVRRIPIPLGGEVVVLRHQP